jgi:predicted regulator of Ras-like GTPase activity (Roadblock/LC7/MglB family)
MKQMLQRLEGCPGVKGSVVMTLDGVVVAASPEAEDFERVAAFVSTVLLSIERDAENLGFSSLKRLTLWAGRGRVIVVPMVNMVLVVVADRSTDLSYALMEVAGLTKGLTRRSKITLPT